MARASAMPALCGLLVLQCMVLQGAVEAAVGVAEGVQVAWLPTTTCVDVLDDPLYNCQKCNQFDSKCVICRPGFAFNARGECARCSDVRCMDCGLKLGPCKTCSSVPDSDPRSRFNLPYPTYQNATGTCLPCNSQRSNTGCLTCDVTGTSCTKCNDGYYLLNGVCTKCSGGLMCQTCNSRGVCTKCKPTNTAPSFGLNAAKQCVRCASRQCVDCGANNLKCRRCANGAVGMGQRGYGATVAGTCTLCSDPLCAVCTANPAKCFTCLSDDYRKFYPYMDAAGVCRRGTIRGCLYYKKDGSCRECDTGYIQAGRGCDKLPKCRDPNCDDCRGNTSGCRTCKRKYFWNKRQRACQPCKVDSCDVCSDSSRSTCQVCSRGFGLISGGRKCQACAAQSAQPWNVPWCDVCNGNTAKCTKCFPSESYKPNASGRCVPRV